MIGSCLCGGVSFSIEGQCGPFELCHCSRCRKASGSAFVAALVSETQGFKLLSGGDLIKSFAAPIINNPPAYTVFFCSVCGSHVPDPDSQQTWMDIPAGLLDDDPLISPDKHIYIDHKAKWDKLDQSLPVYTESEFKSLG